MRILAMGLKGCDLQALRDHCVMEIGYQSTASVNLVVETLRDNESEVFLFRSIERQGLPFVRMLRKAKEIVPIVVLIDHVSNGREWSLVRSEYLEFGADDVISSGMPRELLASLSAVTRRFKGSTTDVLEFTLDDMTLRIEKNMRLVYVNDIRLGLTHSQFEILSALATRSGGVCSRSYLIAHALDPHGESEISDRSVDSQVKYVRRKLKKAVPKASNFIETVYSDGYRIHIAP